MRPLDNERLTALAQASEESGLSVEEIVQGGGSSQQSKSGNQENRSSNQE
jgi:hypothetical protein